MVGLCIILSAPAVRSDWVYLPPVDRIAASTLVFTGTAKTALKESAGEYRWHVADVTVDAVLIGLLTSETVTIRTIDPASLECAPNAGLMEATGRRFLWNFYRTTRPLEFSSTDGPLVDLDDAKAVRALISDIEAALARNRKLSTEARGRLKTVLADLRQQ